MDRTLTPEALESFQRTLGARPIAFRDWFYSKLYQFLAILLHDRVQVATNSLEGHGPPRTEEPWREGEGVLEGIGPDVHPDALERAFNPSAPGLYDWGDLVRRSTQASQGQRLAAAMEFVESCAQQRAKTRRLDLEKGKRPHGDEDIEERDQLIAAQLMKGVSRNRICQLLDRKRSPVTENMWEHGIETWIQAWEDVEFRRDGQSIFSKAQSRFTSHP